MEEVFHVAENVYTYGEAANVCAALDAKLANYDQVEEAHAQGAEWCGYGWSEGQMAFYPTQKSTWAALQAASTDPTKRAACGRPGVNGGYMTNPDMKFGVNCYGVKPARGGRDLQSGAVASGGGGGGGGDGGSSMASKYPRDKLRLQSFSRTEWSGVAP